MRMIAVITCPLWERPDGQRTIGIQPCDDRGDVVGWVNVLDLEIHGERRLLLAAGVEKDA